MTEQTTTNIQRVRNMLPAMSSKFTISDMYEALQMELSRDQISKALRSIEFVESHGNGSFSVGGRKTR